MFTRQHQNFQVYFNQFSRLKSVELRPFIPLTARCVTTGSRAKKQPLVAVVACHWQGDFLHSSRHGSGDKYIRTLTDFADVIPLLIPSLTNLYENGWEDRILDKVDGVFLTGSPSNLHPSHYGVTPTTDHEPYDQCRDAASLSLILRTLDRGLPFLGVCRGHQELNVALGGTLTHEVNKLPDKIYHGFPTDNFTPDDKEYTLTGMDQQNLKYGEAHDILTAPRGVLRKILNGAERVPVNSCHYQAIDRLSDRLVVEAAAVDGVVEAASVRDYSNFSLSVQWHPEYVNHGGEMLKNSKLIFGAFGDACRKSSP